MPQFKNIGTVAPSPIPSPNPNSSPNPDPDPNPNLHPNLHPNLNPNFNPNQVAAATEAELTPAVAAQRPLIERWAYEVINDFETNELKARCGEI